MGTHLIGNNTGQGGLTESGRSVKEDVIHCLPSGPGSLYLYNKPFLDGFLSYVFLKPCGTKGMLNGLVFICDIGFDTSRHKDYFP